MQGVDSLCSGCGSFADLMSGLKKKENFDSNPNVSGFLFFFGIPSAKPVRLLRPVFDPNSNFPHHIPRNRIHGIRIAPLNRVHACEAAISWQDADGMACFVAHPKAR